MRTLTDFPTFSPHWFGCKHHWKLDYNPKESITFDQISSAAECRLSTDFFTCFQGYPPYSAHVFLVRWCSSLWEQWGWTSASPIASVTSTTGASFRRPFAWASWPEAWPSLMWRTPCKCCKGWRMLPPQTRPHTRTQQQRSCWRRRCASSPERVEWWSIPFVWTKNEASFSRDE